jgi:hypothetical protein
LSCIDNNFITKQAALRHAVKLKKKTLSKIIGAHLVLVQQRKRLPKGSDKPNSVWRGFLGLGETIRNYMPL